MFKAIDYENWERREIYDRFQGYTYSVTAELDVSKMLQKIHRAGFKFYPSVCWCIAKTVNEDRDYRYARIEGKVGYYETLNPCYTLMRKGDAHLFTHMVTDYTEDFAVFYENFLRDKALAEACDSLYYYKKPLPGCVDITIFPGTAYKAISYSRPAAFVSAGSENEYYIPFITVGKYEEKEEAVPMPVTGVFNHAVNDGYHAEKFFALLQKNMDKIL